MMNNDNHDCFMRYHPDDNFEFSELKYKFDSSTRLEYFFKVIS